MEHNHNNNNYDHLIGVTVRGRNMRRLGVVVWIDYSDDGYRHQNAIAVLDTGLRMNCRRFDGQKVMTNA